VEHKLRANKQGRGWTPQKRLDYQREKEAPRKRMKPSNYFCHKSYDTKAEHKVMEDVVLYHHITLPKSQNIILKINSQSNILKTVF
jgi:hypothetical protein